MKTETSPHTGLRRARRRLLSLSRAFGVRAIIAAAGGAIVAGAAFGQSEKPEPAAAEAAPATATPEDGPTYPVSAIEIRYLRENPAHPPIEEAMALSVVLGDTTTGYVAPREGVPLVERTLAEIADRPLEAYHASAIQHILERLRDYYVAQDILGVYVAPDPTQINEVGQDLRPAGQTTLVVIVTTGIVTEMRTVASGERVREGGSIEPADRIDNPAHARILARSPVRPHQEGEEEQQDLLKKNELDRYLFHLSRHPGRRVDASVAAAEEIGGIALDYQITENKPLTLYAQVSNTGTDSTGDWRERFGFFDTQFTNNDDILSLDYTTADFTAVHALTASYDAPFPNDRIRWRVAGGWDRYTAQDVGLFNDDFTGETWWVSPEIRANIYQKRELFVDLVGGARLHNEEVDNPPFYGNQFFICPYVGVRLERATDWLTTDAAVLLEFEIGDLTDVSEYEIQQLGRTDPDRNWQILKWDFVHSVYLEPLLDRKAWEDPSTPESSTLAHELRLVFRGQYAFDNRLIPQEEQVAGGLYSVRGYPESAVAGDTVLIGNFEYRFHVPHAFPIEPEPRELFGQPFRYAPQFVYGTTDWDLVLKGFVDVGWVDISKPFSFEQNYTLVGAGIGVDFLYRRNLNMRLDWGFVLDGIESVDADLGSSRLHFVATLLF